MSEVAHSTRFAELSAEVEQTLLEDPRNGFTKAQQLLEYAEAIAEPSCVNKARELLSRCYQANGNYHKALQVCLEALAYFESIEDYAWAARCLNNLGAAYNFLGEHENRLQTNLTCLSYRRKGGDEAGEISTLNNIGDTYNALGNHEKALEYFNLCLQFDSITDRTRTIVIHNLGETEFYKGNYGNAQDYLLQAVQLARKTSYFVIEEVAFVFLAKIHVRNGNYLPALECLDEAEKIARDKNYTSDLPGILSLRAEVAEQQGRAGDAVRYYKEYIALTEQIRKENDIRAMQDMQFAYRVEKLEEENRAQKEKNREIRQAYLKIAQQHRVIEEKNRSITDSINYAYKIQSALLPSEWRFSKAFPESFIFNRPRDIVSGDFYWLHESGSHITLAVADCTGHGVPGALMSIVGIDCLNIVITDPRATDPAKILSLLDEKVISALNMETANATAMDGMDIVILRLDKRTGEISMASANRPVFVQTGNELITLKPDKFPIGGYFGNEKKFNTRKLSAGKGEMIYLFSDGFSDQFGGERGKKLKLKGFHNFVSRIATLPVTEQAKEAEAFFDAWKGQLEQLDDVLVVGLRFPVCRTGT